MFAKKFYEILFIFSILFLIYPQMQASAADKEVEIEDPTPDLEAPILIDVNVTSENLTPTAPVKVIADFFDGNDGSGVKSASITYRKPNGVNQTFNFTPNASSNKYEAVIQAMQQDVEGKWEVNNIYVVDKKDNERRIYHSSTIHSNDTFDFTKIALNVSGTIKQTDFEAPILKEVMLPLAEVKSGEKIQISVVATDNESGVTTARAYYKKPSGKTISINLSRESLTDVYTGTYIVKPYDEPGQWILTSIELVDKAGNRGTYTSYISDDGKDKTLNHGSVTIIGTTLDSEAPVIQNIYVQSNNVKNKESIKLSVVATDNFSGVATVRASYKKPSGNTLTINLYKETGTNIFTGTSIIGQYDELGTYELTSIITDDLAGNSITYNRNSQINNGATKLELSDVIISGTTPDYEAPVLEFMKIGVSQLTSNTAEVKYTAEATDILSGISSFSGRYSRPSGRSLDLIFTKIGNEYVAKIPIDKFDELGKWKLTTISITDNRGNRRTINFNDSDGYYFVVNGKITIPPGKPNAIEVADDLNMLSGETFQLKPILKYTNGAEQDITSDPITEYTSSDPTSVTISKNGLIKVNDKAKSGKVYIGVTYGNISKTVWITINGGSNGIQLEVNPLKANLSNGQQQQINVVEVNAGGRKDVASSGSGIIYTSSNPALITVSKDGLITANSGSLIGVAVIRVSYNDMNVEVNVEVSKPTVKSLTISPDEENMSLSDNRLQLIVNAIMSNGTTKDVTGSSSGTIYTSSNKLIAQVNSEGLVTIPSDAKSGDVTITAKNGNISINTVLHVKGNPDLIELIVDSFAEEMILGEKQQINITTKWSDGSIKQISPDEATIISSRTDRVTIDSFGMVEAISLGTASVDITYQGKVVHKIVNVVSGPHVTNLSLDKTLPSSLKIGEEFAINNIKAHWSNGTITVLDVSDATYSSSRTDRLTVSQDGILEAKSSGQASITISYKGKSITSSISVEAAPKPSSIYFETPSPNRITLGDVYTLGNLKAKWSDGSITDIALQDATITSSRTDRLSITGANLEALALGQSIISVIYNGVSTTFTMNVDNGPVVSSLFFGDVVPSKLKSGEKFTLNNLKANMSDGSVIDIAIVDAELSSSRTDRVSINANGELQALVDGSSTITIKYGGKLLNHTIMVEGGLKPSSIYFETPTPNRITIGDVYTLGNLKAKWPDGSITDINLQDTTITSSYTNRLSVAGANLEALALGASTISVKYSGITMTFSMTVDNGPVVSSLYFGNIVPTTLKLGEKFTLNQLKASMTDGSVVDVAIIDAELSSSRIDRVSVSPNGVLEGLGIGTSSITVKYGGKSIVISVKVDPAPTVSSITLENPFPTTMRINDKVTVGNIVVKWSDGSTTTESISDATITSTRSDRVEVNGIVLEAKAVGTTYVDVVYKGKSIRINLQVNN